MDILIVYGTHEGQTEKISRFLAERLRKLGNHVDVMNAARPRPEVAAEHYGAIIIGAPVRKMKYPLAVINFARTNRARLDAVPSAFFSVCMAAASPKAERRSAAATWPERFFHETGWHPRLSATFAGALRYRQYNFLLRWMMKRISRAEGVSTDTAHDHEYTDWVAVTRFADNFAREVLAQSEAAAEEHH